MQSTVRLGGALLLASGLIACGDRSSSQPATSTAQPAAASQQSALTGEELTRRTVERRAIEAINWGMPAVNEDLMLQAMIVSAKGQTNQIAYWSRLPDWKILTLTPNPTSSISRPSSTRRTPVRWCWRFRPPTVARSLAPSWTPGRRVVDRARLESEVRQPLRRAFTHTRSAT